MIIEDKRYEIDLIINTSINAVLAIQNAIKTGCSYCGYTWSIEQR